MKRSSLKGNNNDSIDGAKGCPLFYVFFFQAQIEATHIWEIIFEPFWDQPGLQNQTDSPVALLLQESPLCDFAFIVQIQLWSSYRCFFDQSYLFCSRRSWIWVLRSSGSFSLDDFVICKSRLPPVLSLDVNALLLLIQNFQISFLGKQRRLWRRLTCPPHSNLIFSLSVKFKCHSTIHVYGEDSNIHPFSFFQNCFNFSEVKGLFNLWKLSMESINMTYSVYTIPMLLRVHKKRDGKVWKKKKRKANKGLIKIKKKI